ncbi:hypothetical protein SO802_009307 [Lithocarpus litseifolius]|uniref:RNase H type-1 domain-containing protein n=1 Tax=Lithocarpus litseifolius TaxID=425828 RepID=A0AAW2DEW0_9ROSI
MVVSLYGVLISLHWSYPLARLRGQRQMKTNFVANVVSPHLPPDLKATWVPPTGSFYKVNVDGAMFSSQKEAGVWVIIRDDKGLVVAALSKKIPDPLGAFEASIQLAKDVGIHELVLEGDSIIGYWALTSTSPSPTSVVPIIYGGQPRRNRRLRHLQLKTRILRFKSQIFGYGFSFIWVWVLRFDICGFALDLLLGLCLCLEIGLCLVEVDFVLVSQKDEKIWA